MIRALLVELTRLRWRRAVVVLLTLGLLSALVVVAVIAWSTRPVSEGDRVRAQEQASAEAARPGVEREVGRCEHRPRQYGVTAASVVEVREACEQAVVPQPEWFLDRSPLVLDDVRDGGADLGLVALLSLVLVLVGTTFAGHDWNTGSMSNQLLFEARRTRVWVAKAGAVALVGLAFSAVALALFWGLLASAATVWGEPSATGTAGRVWAEVWRVGLLSCAAGVGGYALTMLLRSTVASLGILFAVVVVAPLVLASSGSTVVQRLAPQNNLTALVVGSLTVTNYQDEACFEYTGRRGDPLRERCETVIDRSEATTYFASLLLAVAAASVLSFRRRDVG